MKLEYFSIFFQFKTIGHCEKPKTGLKLVCNAMCLIKDFHGGSARLGNFKLMLNYRKNNQPDWIRFQTSKESSKISPSFPLFI
jgi:hypothetical protein